MPFDLIERRINPGAPDKPVSMTLKARKAWGEAYPACIINLSAPLVTKLGTWRTGDPIRVEIGSGSDSGRLRLARAQLNSIAQLRAIGRFGGLAVDVGHIPQLGSEAQSRTPADASVIDENTIEIIIPEWREADIDQDDEPQIARNVPPPPPARPNIPARQQIAVRATPQQQTPPVPELPFRSHGIVIEGDRDNETISFKGKELEITTRQARMLALLGRAFSQPVGKSFLVSKLWNGKVPDSAESVVTQAINDLRPGLASIGLAIKDTKGVGVALQIAGAT